MILLTLNLGSSHRLLYVPLGRDALNHIIVFFCFYNFFLEGGGSLVKGETKTFVTVAVGMKELQVYETLEIQYWKCIC